MRRLLKNAAPGAILVAALALSAVAGVRSETPPTNVLLITLDTVRADHLGSYGYQAAATPSLDRLAREGVRFADATSQAPLTGPAHAALLTGVYPARYGLRDNASTPIPADRPTLAEILRRAGYRTAAFVSAFVLDRAYGFDQGFDVFDSRFSGYASQDKRSVSRTAEDVVKGALRWLERAPPGRPFFAWVHFYDAHAPYSPPEPYRTRFSVSAYDGEIAYVDSAVGKLIASLERRGLLDRTLVVAIADHGEGLGDHGEVQHGVFLYDSVLHVPWLLRLPGRQRAGSVVNEQVRSVDLLPTVLELLGVRVPRGLDGVSVVGPMRGQARAKVPPSYAESFYGKLLHGWSETYSLRVGEWKLIDAPRPELYDLRKDGREAANLVDQKPGVAGRLAGDLREMGREFGSGVMARARPPDRETVERLGSLGYVGVVTTPGAGTGRAPDPKDGIGQLGSIDALLSAAGVAMQQNRAGAAIVSLKRALVIDDRSYDAHLVLGNVYMQTRQFAAALGEYDAAALLHPGSIDPLIGSAAVFAAQGNVPVALERIRQAEALTPRSHEIPLNRGIIAEMQGRLDEAFELYRRAVSANPSDPRAKARLAEAAARRRRWDIAAPMFASLLEMGWQPSRAHFGLGQAAEARGDAAAAAREFKHALALDPAFEAASTALARLRAR